MNQEEADQDVADEVSEEVDSSLQEKRESTRLQNTSWCSRQVQSAIHQMRLNRLTSTASYQAFIGQITSPICPHCGTGEETAEHLLLFCPKWAAERQRYFGESVHIIDLFQDSDNLVIPRIFRAPVSPCPW